MKKLSLVVFLLVLLGVTSATNVVEAGEWKWVATYGKGNVDGLSAEPAEEGYYLGTVHFEPEDDGKEPLGLMRVNERGELLWKKEYRTEHAAGLKEMIPGADGGYLLGGHISTGEKFTRGNYLVIKVDDRGEPEWALRFGEDLEPEKDGKNSGAIPRLPYNYSFYSIRQAHDGGYIAAGFYLPEMEMPTGKTETETRPDTYGVLVKISQQGEVEWQKKYGGGGIDSFSTIRKTADGNYAVVGMEHAFDKKGFVEVWLTKIDPKGEVIWQKTYGSETDLGLKPADFGLYLETTQDGGFLITSYAGAMEGESEEEADAWVARLNEQGQVRWQKTYGGADFDSVTRISETPDGGFIFSGVTSSFGSPGKRMRIWLAKLNRDGSIRWEKVYGKPGVSTNGGAELLPGGKLLIHGLLARQAGQRQGLFMILNKNGELTGLEETALRTSPTRATSEVTSVKPLIKEIPYERSNVPVSRVEVSATEVDGAGLNFVIEPFK